MSRRPRALALLGFSVLVASSVLPVAALAQTVVEDGVVTRKEAAPKRLNGIDVEEHLDRALPLSLDFVDTSGQRGPISRFVTGERPVIFTLNYSDCPMLCSLQLNALASSLGKLDRKLGHDFDVVTVSLNPAETTERARETEARYRGDVAAARDDDARGEKGAGAGSAILPGGWHFLTGSKANIDALADALGIRYGYNEARKEYVHPAVLVLATPSGHISRYLYGIEYEQKTLSLSLVEAAEGKIGTSMDRLILYCFHYDDSEGKYAPVAMNIMRVGGSLTALALGSFLGAYWFRQARRRGLPSLPDAALASAESGATRSPTAPSTGELRS
ncbi:MAG TPA: SCO family protein [Polyangiaceae bacterium]|nr:SCO family protein [Polyangiaceae bacterium]